VIGEAQELGVLHTRAPPRKGSSLTITERIWFEEQLTGNALRVGECLFQPREERFHGLAPKEAQPQES
jgi:hypothetical protein